MAAQLIRHGYRKSKILLKQFFKNFRFNPRNRGTYGGSGS